MLECWTEQYARPDTPSATFTVSNLREHILKATLNVFCGAGFGVPLPFKPSSHSISTEEAVQTEQSQFKDAPAPPPGYHFTFRHVLEYMNRHLSAIFIAVGILPKWLSKLLASYFRTELNAYHDLGNYLRSLISLAKHDDEGHAHDLLAGLVRSQQDERLKNDPDSDTPRRNVGLTDEEVLGNMYIFTLAGHETTATTLRYALVQLALDQDLQEELYREIQEVTRAEPADWDYDRVFPRLVLPLCIMVRPLLPSIMVFKAILIIIIVGNPPPLSTRRNHSKIYRSLFDAHNPPQQDLHSSPKYRGKPQRARPPLCPRILGSRCSPFQPPPVG